MPRVKISVPRPFLYIALITVSAGLTHAATYISSGTATLDGTIDGAYTHTTENPYSGPVTGGSGANSDFLGETASQYYYDGSTTHNLGSNRADIRQTYVTWDANNLYLAISGPNVMYNSFNNASGPDNDQGDLFIALDTGARGAAASGSLDSNSGWGSNTTAGFGGAKGVDFDGWTPEYVVAVQYVDNGGGGGGNAQIVDLAGSSATSEAQNQGNGGFDWHANTTSIGTIEFAIPWTLLGYGVGFDPTQAGNEGTIRFAAYTTHNNDDYDVYDSGPGQGNGSDHEQIGDFFGDTDSSFPDTDNDGSTSGTQPGSNQVTRDGTVGHDDEIDTIEQYWAFDFGTSADGGAVPEPGTTALLGLGGLLVQIVRKRRMVRE